MFNREMMLCLEQKEILLTDILNLTKQIEVRCGEPEANLEHLLEIRAALMTRCDKCDRLLESLAGQLPEEERAFAAEILHRRNGGRSVAGEEGQRAMALLQHCDVLFSRAAALNRLAMENLKKRRDNVQEKLKQARRAGKPRGIFYSR